MPAPALRTLVVCDLVDSTALVERIGDARALALFRRHDRAARDLIAKRRGQEIDKTDGFLLLFDRPIEALAFALEYQRLLRELSRDEQVALKARVGVHVGEVVVFENADDDVSRGAKRVEVEGLVKPVAARLMGLALPGQVLVSGVLFGLTQRADPELRAAFPGFVWKSHGRYAFKGVPAPMQVYEIGERPGAPMLKPVSTDKAWRARPLWLRPRALLAELAVIVFASAVVLYVMTRTEPAIAFAERDWVVLGHLRNLTSEPVFDGSLETALRISLDQSRHVNLVPELSTRRTLARMRRPEDAVVDRELGSEIAVREGARALILPTIAEVGGRLRVSLEVVDPATQATVYAETADGTGLDSALESVDTVAERLRARLGEATASIERDSAPLPQVTTANLDALRAYALAVQQQARSRFDEAIALYRRALELDPEFALAEMGLARIHFNADQFAESRVYLDRALAHRARLTARDRAYLDAWRHNFGNPADAIRQWRLMSQMYPDYFGAHYNYAYHASRADTRYAEALEAAVRATDERNSFIASAWYLRGALALVLDRHDDARSAFEHAIANGVGGTVLQIALAHAARRDWSAADRHMSTADPSGLSAVDVFDRRGEILRALDHGDLASARAAALRIAPEAAAISTLHGDVFETSAVSLDALAPSDAGSARLEALLDRQLAALARRDGPGSSDAAFAIAYLGYLAARSDRPMLARRALASAAASPTDFAYPNAERMLAIVRAQLALADGDADAAHRHLAPQLRGEPLYLAHRVSLEAWAAAGDAKRALEEAAWLVSHRGRAYGETVALAAPVTLNVAEATLAHLRAAELALAIGDRERASSELAEFDRAWPAAKTEPAWSDRRESLRARVAGSGTAAR
ncbi:MAG TPA: putative peptide modification system cyclase [Candidatus Saccharimonadia bacterium]|nr:putative peptide modification system cyclase [Candidatus Saccharimonadia bacterium]